MRTSNKKNFHLYTGLLTLLVFGFISQAQASPSLYVRAPISGERVSQGEIIKVQWFQNEVAGAVNIQVWQANHGKWYELASGVDARLGEVNWQVPRTISGKCRIKIVSAHDETVEAFGGSFFFIEEADSGGGTPAPQVNNEIIQIAPNPAETSVDITWPVDVKAFSISVVDLLGNEMYRQKLAGQHSIVVNTADWATGAYRVQLHGAAELTWHSTLVVQR